MKRLVFIAIGIFCFTLINFSAQAQSAVPALQGAVNDHASALSSAQQLELENVLTTFSKEKGSQIAVLIVKSTEPEQIEQFSIRVADAWKLGRKGIDDGVLLVVATEDRRIRIEVGYGLEGAVPDARAKRIIEDYILPQFRQGEVYSGIRAGVDALIKLINGEELPAPEVEIPDGLNTIAPIFIIIGSFAAHVLRLVVGTPLAMLITAIATFALGLLISVQFALIITVIVIIFSMAGLGSYRHGYGGGYSSGGVSGGFRGGGGGFGGGGASGRW